MKPLTVRLKGFRGFRDGLGRDEVLIDLQHLSDGAQLVALVGMNGRGKTTLMDNLHPVMLISTCQHEVSVTRWVVSPGWRSPAV